MRCYGVRKSASWHSSTGRSCPDDRPKGTFYIYMWNQYLILSLDKVSLSPSVKCLLSNKLHLCKKTHYYIMHDIFVLCFQDKNWFIKYNVSCFWIIIQLIKEIIAAVTIPVMAKARIGHFAEAQILESLGVDMIDESEGMYNLWRLHDHWLLK